MEILKSEFEEKLPFIREALLDADFISIDTEFTGLSTPNTQFQHNDDMSTRYSKLKSCVQEFTIIQYGVCAFKRNEKGDFVAKPFNFYIFGADTEEIHANRIFSATPSSLSFLRSNKFNFNKLIDEGIPFYNLTEEKSMFQSTYGTNMILRSNMIKESQLTNSGRNFLDYNRRSIDKWFKENSDEPLSIQVNTPFFKRLIYQEIQDAKYNDSLQATQIDAKHLSISKITEKKELTNSPKLNFRTIIEYIKEAGCPVVAHNAAFDIFHTVEQFWRYLPNDVEDFKQVTNSMWPTIVDTKYLAEYHPSLKNCFNTSVLGSLYTTVFEELKEAGQNIVMGENFDRYTGEGNDVEHEAGYDAYMTGVIYLAFMAFINEKQANEKKQGDIKDTKFLGKRKRFDDSDEKVPTKERKLDDETKETSDESEEESNEKSDASEEESDTSEEESDSEEGEIDSSDSEEEGQVKKESMFMNDSVTPYYGRIFLMRSEIPFINLKGEEIVEVVTYPNKFYLHNIPVGLTQTAIEKLFPTILPIAVSWTNESNAWIILKDESKIPFVRLGVVGYSVVQSFLPGFSRAVEGVAYGITKEASQMELLSHEKWQELYGPKKTVNYNNTASILKSNTIKPELKEEPKEDSPVPTGGSGYDDLDIPLPPSFAALKK